MDTLETLGLLNKKRSCFTDYGFGRTYKAAQYWPSEALLAFASSHGIDPIRDYPAVSYGSPSKLPPQGPIVVEEHATKQALGNGKSVKVKGKSIAYDPLDPLAIEYAEFIARLNQRVAEADIKGVSTPAFFIKCSGSLNLHSRIYNGDCEVNYQNIPKERRRAEVIIDGEPTAEIDYHASWLSLLYAASGTALPKGDLYTIPELDRACVKAFVTATIGNGKPLKSWPSRAKAAAKGRPPFKVVAAKVLAKHPVLHHPAVLVGVHPEYCAKALMHIEAGLLRAAIDFFAPGVALPLHDALIVPKGMAQRAKEAMLRAAALVDAEMRVTITG
ncbi:hypothetical protein [Arboricoccus pini]|nr:hypothetical protein [Arboricoccus pini]